VAQRATVPISDARPQDSGVPTLLTRPLARLSILLPLALALVLAVLVVREAAASRPVIPPERERDIAALFQPYEFGEELTPGWTFHSFAIDRATVVVWVAGPGFGKARLFGRFTLDHPDYAPPDSRRVGSFALTIVDQPAGSEAALAVLSDALARNDAGRFWPELGAIAADGEPTMRFAGKWAGWSRDGLLAAALLLASMLALLGQALHEAGERRRLVGGVLVAIVVVAALLRWWLTPLATLEPWSYDRFMVVARMIYEGPLLARLQSGPVFATDAITTTVLVCALLAPLSVYLLARALLADERAALASAGIVAILPMHIRFSHGDVASIPSLTIAALTFALAHAAVRARQPWWWLAALPGVVLGLGLAFLLRPLNILYAPLVLAAVYVHQGVHVDKASLSRPRFVALALVVVALTALVGVPHLLGDYADNVREGLSLDTLVSMVRVLLSVEFNTLINPRFTPPGLSALAIVGAWSLARRKRWRLFALLVGWLLASLGTHAYVVPRSPFMQARYHLHLVVPFVCLAACGLEALLERVRAHPLRKPIAALVFAYLLASPLLHRGFIRDVDFNDQREWTWVHGLRDTIPPDCTILEYGGVSSGARFARVGSYVERNVPRRRWQVIELLEPAQGEPELDDAVRELLADPPACTYWYEGLTCFGNRPADTAIAPVCAAIPGFVALEEVERLEFESRPYDENLAEGLTENEPVVLRLYRVHRRAPEN
jgi:hypothetical protein